MDSLKVRYLGQQPFETVWQSMRDFTDARDANTTDECWVVEHPSVFTLGQAGKTEHILNPQHIPVVQTDRGGQVTYHGPGQIIIYLMLDLRRHKNGIRCVVRDVEKGVIQFLALHQITGHAKEGAPGIYVDEKKIASIGMRVRHGCTYHGLSFNYDMDLTPFSFINPCGYPGLAMTEFAAFVPFSDKQEIQKQLVQCLAEQLHYGVQTI